jgi:hypothetical protein
MKLIYRFEVEETIRHYCEVEEEYPDEEVDWLTEEKRKDAAWDKFHTRTDPQVGDWRDTIVESDDPDVEIWGVDVTESLD